MSLNLARRPFVNSRPVRRLVFFLWCVGLLLVAANVFFYTRHFTGQQERLDRLAALREQEASERQRIAELEAELAGFDVDWQNRQVEFLNLRIAERVFPWSLLFDRLTEVLPRQVRLTRLRPRIEGPEESVRLEIRGEARNEEAILEFVGALFEHPAFREPNLASEDRRARSSITEFTLSATYLPARAATEIATSEGPAAADSAAEAERAAAEEGEEATSDGEDGGAAREAEGPADPAEAPADAEEEETAE